MPKLSWLAATTLLLTFAFLTPSVYAQTQNQLYVMISKSLLEPDKYNGDSYIVYVYEDKKTFKPYNGLLEVASESCYLDSSGRATDCGHIWGTTSSPKFWPDSFSVNRVINGKIEVKIPKDFRASVIKARFRPRSKNNWAWSNTIQSNIGTKEGLIDMARYWNLPTTPTGDSTGYPAIFRGENRTFNPPVAFRSYFGFAPEVEVCGVKARPLFITKERTEAYWAPELSYYKKDNLVRYSRDEYWMVMGWDRREGWHDEYLWARGDTGYNFTNLNIFDTNNHPFTGIAAEVSRQAHGGYKSWNPAYPPYILGARYVGEGWGIENEHSYTDKVSSSCDPVAKEGGKVRWVIEARSIDMKLPSGRTEKTVRIAFHEGSPNFATYDLNNKTATDNGMLREDWYFKENLGLVRINVVNFGYNKYYNWLFPNFCPLGDDCFKNDEIQNPDVTLTRYSLLDRIEGDVNGDAAVDSDDASVLMSSYGKSTSYTAMSAVSTRDTRPVDADLNNDGKINAFEIAAMLENYGK